MRKKSADLDVSIDLIEGPMAVPQTRQLNASRGNLQIIDIFLDFNYNSQTSEREFAESS